jgi:hypothetical protein
VRVLLPATPAATQDLHLQDHIQKVNDERAPAKEQLNFTTNFNFRFEEVGRSRVQTPNLPVTRQELYHL